MPKKIVENSTLPLFIIAVTIGVPVNAPVPTVVIAGGIVISVNAQFLKALDPIVVTVDGIVI
jgi:hypothetical protein